MNSKGGNRKMEEVGVKRLYIVIPQPLFRRMQELGYMGDIDSIVTRLLYKDVKEKEIENDTRGK